MKILKTSSLFFLKKQTRFFYLTLITLSISWLQGASVVLAQSNVLIGEYELLIAEDFKRKFFEYRHYLLLDEEEIESQVPEFYHSSNKHRKKNRIRLYPEADVDMDQFKTGDYLEIEYITPEAAIGIERKATTHEDQKPMSVKVKKVRRRNQ